MLHLELLNECWYIISMNLVGSNLSNSFNLCSRLAWESESRLGVPEQHRWLLFALLDSYHRNLPFRLGESLECCYESLCPPEVHQPYKSVLNELSNAFVRKSPDAFKEGIDWVHPSCRDLAVEELAESRIERKRFLERCTESGLLLATSLAGGAKGERILPLLETSSDWEAFSRRAEELVEAEPSFLIALWNNCAAITAQSQENVNVSKDALRFKMLIQERLIPKASSVLGRERRAYRDFQALSAFFGVCKGLLIPAQISLNDAWKECVEDAEDWANSNSVIWQDDRTPTRVHQFLSVVGQYIPNEYKSAVASGIVAEIIQPIAERSEVESNSYYSFKNENPEDLAEIAQSYEGLAKKFEEIGSLPGLTHEQRSQFAAVSSHFENQASSLLEDAPREPDSDGEHYSRESAEELSVEELFRDL